MTRIDEIELMRDCREDKLDAWDVLKFEVSRPFNWFMIGLFIGTIIHNL